jgi:septal ring factor EnvC (AmiA/AmiB activator)
MPSKWGRSVVAGSLALATVLPLGCHRMTEREALEAAREEVREEMQPEIDKRRREIESLKRQVEETRARLAAREARQNSLPSP